MTPTLAPFTSAEQFGLVGSRIFAVTYGTGLPGAEVINLDTLDDRGPLRVWYHTGAGAGLAGEVARRLQHNSLAARTRRPPLLMAVDSVPLARSDGRWRRADGGRLTANGRCLRLQSSRRLPPGRRFLCAGHSGGLLPRVGG